MVGPGPPLGGDDESAAYALMPGVLRDNECRQPRNVARRVYRCKRVGGNYPHDPALQLCNKGYRGTPFREPCQAAREIWSIGWVPELPKQAGQGRCIAVRGFANVHRLEV